MTKKNLPRGIRNRNVLNIRKGSNWRGMIGNDGQFCTFVSYSWGIRAALRILQNYIKRGDDTVYEIIATWAPPSDGNDTNGYVSHVCHLAHLTPTTLISLDNSKQVCRMLWAMACVECGANELNAAGVTIDDFELGYMLYKKY